MKILYYSAHPNLNLSSPSGYGTHMREMISAFEELGHTVKPVIMGGTRLSNNSITINKRGPLKNLIASCIPSYLWETAKDAKLLYYDNCAKRTLAKEVESFQPDLIYERATYLQTSGVSLANERGINHILEVNSPYVEERQVLQGKSFYLSQGVEAERLQLYNTKKVVVVSTELKKHFNHVHQICLDKFLVAPNAINPAKLKYNSAEAIQIKSNLNLENKLVIGFVGSIFPWHGVDLLIDAFSMLNGNIQNAHLLIVGDGEILSSLIKKATRLGLTDRITFTGNVPHKEVFNYINIMEICVMAKSNWYGSPVKIFEYGALGKAIVAPDNAPIRDVMVHRKTGLLTSATAEGIASALLTYYNNSSLRDACAANFQKKVLAEHTWAQNAQRILNTLN